MTRDVMWEIIKIIFQNVIIFSFKSFKKNLIQELILKNNNEDRCSLFYEVKIFLEPDAYNPSYSVMYFNSRLLKSSYEI